MPTVEALTEPAIQEALKTLPGWSLENNAIVRTVKFDSFLWAIQFVNAVAHLAERQNHHPDLDIRYTTVTVRYWTHTAKGVTLLDFDGAKEVESLLQQFKKGPAIPV